MSTNKKEKPKSNPPIEEAWKPDTSQLRRIALSEDEKKKGTKNDK